VEENSLSLLVVFANLSGSGSSSGGLCRPLRRIPLEYRVGHSGPIDSTLESSRPNDTQDSVRQVLTPSMLLMFSPLVLH